MIKIDHKNNCFNKEYSFRSLNFTFIFLVLFCYLYFYYLAAVAYFAIWFLQNEIVLVSVEETLFTFHHSSDLLKNLLVTFSSLSWCCTSWLEICNYLAFGIFKHLFTNSLFAIHSPSSCSVIFFILSKFK